jgi:hypothetical protein
MARMQDFASGGLAIEWYQIMAKAHMTLLDRWDKNVLI